MNQLEFHECRKGPQNDLSVTSRGVKVRELPATERRKCIWKQWKTIRKRYESLIKLGMSKRWAWRCANSRKGIYVMGKHLG